MRELADRERIDAFLSALAREASGAVDVFLVGGSMLGRGLTSAAEIRAQFATMEPALYRLPAIDPASFRRAVDAVCAPEQGA